MEHPDGTLSRQIVETSQVHVDARHLQPGVKMKPGTYVMLTVSDTGTGMDADTQTHIFEPFFSTKDEKGTGLGLWVSQGIVQAHGGSIKLRSREGRGTTYSVALPIGGPAENDDR